MATTSTRAYAAAHFALELDGIGPVGVFRSIEGGSIRADPMTYQQGGFYDRWRQLGKPKYEDIKVQVGMAGGPMFLAWIKEFFDGGNEAKKVPARRNGAIVAADFYFNERARRHFTGGLIREVTFPKLDGADKNAAYLGVAIAVENIEFQPGKGQKLPQPEAFEKQKLWTSCNFTFELQGFEDSCKRVTKIDSFTVKQNIIEYHMGGMRAPIKTPSQIDFPNIAFYVPEADAAKFMDHAENSSIGKGQGPALKTGAIHIQDNEGKQLFELKFTNADILSITPDRSDSGTDEIKQVKIEIHTESMAFSF